VTKILELTSDTKVTAKEDFEVQGDLIVTGAGDTNFTAVPISQNEIAAHACTQYNHQSSGASTTITSGGGQFDIATGVLTLGSPKGQVLILATISVEALTADNRDTNLNLGIDYTNGGTYSAPAVFQQLQDLYVPLRSAANQKNMTHTVHVIDPMTSSSDGGSYKVRLRIQNDDVANDIIVRAYYFDVIELRR